jgi:hypothetical protein
MMMPRDAAVDVHQKVGTKVVFADAGAAQATHLSGAITMDKRDLLILTLELDPALFTLLNGLREAHFPPERNLVPAHITLFHALPAAEAGPIADELAMRTAHTEPLSLALPAVRFLGHGVALGVVSPGLVALCQTFAQTWAHWLSRQDQQSYRPT